MFPAIDMVRQPGSRGQIRYQRKEETIRNQKRAHQEVEKIFRVLFPEQGLAVREEQIRLCHEMLDTLLGEQIALCDAGVGIGKTYAYLVACVLLRKYSMLTGRGNPLEQRPVVVSTSSIALQKAILTEYIPFLSRVLLEQGIIQSPLRAVVRKGKEHFVCDNRLEQRIEAIRYKQKNAVQKAALLSLRKHYDMDSVKNLSGFDRRLVCVPKFCPRECPGRQMCRYQRYLEESRKQDVFIQICNHNYLLADAYHRAEGYKPLLSDYRTLIVDEAHKLPEAARQMFGKNLCMDDIREIAYYLEREHQKEEAKILRTVMHDALHVVGAEHRIGKGIRETFRNTTNSVVSLWEGVEMLEFLLEKLERSVPKWIRNRLEEAKDVAAEFINGRPNDNIGITLFAGESFTQCPLTVDHAVLLNLLKDMKCGLIEDGTAIGMGIANAVTRLKDSKAKSKVIILLTDGVNNKGDISPLTAAEIAKSFGIRVYTIGVGTNGMAPYPYPVGGTVQYVNMPVEIDEKTLTQIAGTTEGNYFRATSNSKLKEVYEEIDKLEKTKLNVKEYSKRQEEYRWFALAAFLCVLLEVLLRNSILKKIP